MLAVSLLVCATMALTRANGDENLSANISCPTNWTQHDDRCFHFVDTTWTWARAQKHCQSKGGNLASVHSVADILEIQWIIHNNTKKTQVWIGGTDCQEENAWLWADGTHFKFTYWCPGKPDNPLKHCCLQISSRDGTCWEDSLCYQLLPSICAKTLQ
ncbi:type-2 ice-structuring protein-like [Siniperca chuatsi]|uniref:type-2 ice-structuring protein-like n=1 Tax=Siniperca chuatsi TaxID=119488 RepID=UPI001CE05A57|nr:type-2 ice-structuring protein-like [Siniperca chuatsi]XP_044047082.1 type-2 ice-structuring protein-like [Siniperca chuatsi]